MVQVSLQVLHPHRDAYLLCTCCFFVGVADAHSVYGAAVVSLQVLHPHRDAHSVLMVQLFGVDMFYRPTSKHDQPGLIKARDGPLDELGENALLGWAVVPIFKQYVEVDGLW